MSSSLPPIGDVLRVPDRVTGWSDDQTKMRWCMVVAHMGFSVKVMPRSSSSDEGVPVPASAMDRFTEDGHFYNDPKTLHWTDLEGLDNIGPLDDPYRQQVLDLFRQPRERRRRRKGEA